MNPTATVPRRTRVRTTQGQSQFDTYWSRPAAEVLAALHSAPDGLNTDEVAARLDRFGANTVRAKQETTAVGLFLNQFKSPLVLILVFAAIVSALVHEWVDAAVVLVIVLGSALLTFVQEYRAGAAVEALRARITLRTTALRDGRPHPIPSEAIVPGDVVLLSAGSLIPADGLVLDAKDFFVNQSVLTGETFPVVKTPGIVPAQASLAERTNCVFMGTSVRTGAARVLVIETGAATTLGHIAERLSLGVPETEFERGIRRFGYLLTQIMVVLVLIVFAVNVFAQKPPVDSLLFAIALAVGLAPELLPAIIGINLAKGAQHMAAHGVIVRRLNAIEDFGSMDVLCTDKTGTLTEGVVRLDGAVDAQGRPSDEVMRYAYLNAYFQAGLSNPLDEAIIAAGASHRSALDGTTKVDEIPYDFVRKRLSVVVQRDDETPTLITKGALENVLAVCDPLEEVERARIQQRFAQWSSQGIRVLGLAAKSVPRRPAYTRDDECEMTFLGFLLFFDPPKPDVQTTLAGLTDLGVQLKIITGDNRRVAVHVAEMVGLTVEGILTGAEINALRDEALWQLAERTTLFVEVDPNQKERIILALQKMGHVVGYLGDGINDATALHSADVGISVDQAVDVAKEAADFVLLAHDLDVLREGIEEGRRTFANTLKYVFTTTSANFGNMFSMAAASLFLPFLPLLAKQILLNNFLSDVPGMTIAGDRVDREMVEQPRRWNIAFVRDFMVLFGLVSSAFDYLTFGVLLFVFQVTPAQFRTGWFIESLMTELVVALVVRTQRPFYRSRPSRPLLLATLAVAALTLAIPYLPLSRLLGFVPLPAELMLVLLGITALYVAGTEVAKRRFYRHVSTSRRGARQERRKHLHR